MDDTLPARPGRPPGLPALGIDAEVEAKFVEGLRKFGTYSAAARYARPHLAARGSRTCSIAAFREHARRHPEFAAACEEALTDYQGIIEAEMHERAFTVDQRPVINHKTGEVLLCEDRRNANDMLKIIAARLDPASWAAKKNVTVDAKVTHSNTSLTGGAAYIVKPDDILLLSDPEKRKLLIDLLVEIETERKAQLPTPAPVREYGAWAGAAALPAPENANG